jgi:Ion channel
VIDPLRPKAWLHNSGMSVLLMLLIAIVFVIPVVAPGVSNTNLLWDVLMSLVLVSGIAAVAEHRKLTVALALLSAVVIALAVSEELVPAWRAREIRSLATLGAFLLLAIAVGINVFAFGHAVSDRLFGAVVLYLLLGVLWAVAYQLMERLSPGAFAGQTDAGDALAQWAYFSFVTLTTVGYGDITPVALGARSLAISEALVGQLYPAVIIARLVSLQVGSK